LVSVNALNPGYDHHDNADRPISKRWCFDQLCKRGYHRIIDPGHRKCPAHRHDNRNNKNSRQKLGDRIYEAIEYAADRPTQGSRSDDGQ